MWADAACHEVYKYEKQCVISQDADDYMLGESPAMAAAAPHKDPANADGDSSGQSDTEMSDLLKKDPIITKYSKYRVTKKVTHQKTSCKHTKA